MRDFKGHIGRARITSSILIRNLDGEPLFRMIFYGLGMRDLCIISEDPSQNGGSIVAAALERRGIDPGSVMFAIWDVTD